MQITTEFVAMDTISAIAAALACFATFILAYISWRQFRISEKQKEILDKQAFYQEQQTIISKQQAAIMETQNTIAGQQRDILDYQEQERRKDRLKARFEARTIKGDVGRNVQTYLQIENKGPADARDIEMSLIDMLSESPATLSHQVPTSLPYFPSGSVLNFSLMACMGDPLYYYLKISWKDGSDERHSEKIPFDLH